MMRLSLLEPRFDEEAVARIRAQVVAGLRRSERDPNDRAAKLWSATAFPNHPYGQPREGTEETVGNIQRADLADFASRAFGRNNLVVAVVGAIDAETLGPLLDQTFGDLPETAELAPVPDVEPVSGVTVRDTLPVPQTALRFGMEGLKRHDPDFIPAFVMNHILGGGTFSSWLFQEVREKRGLAYSVYSYLVPYDAAGIFGGGTSTRADRADEALSVILGQIERMATEGPTEEELEDAKRYLTGAYALRFGSSSGIARQLLGIQLDDLGIDYVDRRNGLIEAVTLEDVKRAARRVLGSEPTVALVGPGEA
jgi:zinc protease